MIPPTQDALIALPPDEASRVRLAASATTSPRLLAALARDHNLTVRAAVALNGAAPQGVDRALAADADARVRILLAHKLAAFLPPDLPDDLRERVQQHAWDTLAVLVRDEIARVRMTVAELVKDLPNAPHALIMALAEDRLVCVSDPVLRLSPLLTETDLLRLLHGGCAGRASIAKRAGITEAVADAIVCTADRPAITALLANPSAAIRESTLDALVDHAATADPPLREWHAPLIARPVLSPRSTRALAGFVAVELLTTLAARADLSPALVAELEQALATRLAATQPAEAGLPGALAWARALQARGQLTEFVALAAIKAGRADQLTAVIAVAGGLAVAAVQRAAALRSAKAIESLLWQAKFSLTLTGATQALLSSLPPARAATGGGYTEPEMKWQVDFLARAR